jgi:peptidoglycan/LPS O-acetylase OafA/YrhL
MQIAADAPAVSPPGAFAPPVKRRLPELEGLRGLLSWWVVISHALLLSGYSVETLGRGWRLFAHGDQAVDVFIILSGFVIHKLWHDSREPYPIFIARRFLRLWPCFMVCLLAALALRPCFASALAGPPLGDPAVHAQALANWAHEEAHFGAHLAAHVTMLHGAIPETILPGASIALLAQAWSISLEWQFYLVAPLLFAGLNRGRSTAWVLFAAVAGAGWLWRYVPPFDLWFPMQAFLPQKLLLFAVGIVSHELWRAFRDFGGGLAPALLGLAVLSLAFTLSLPLAIWLAVLAVALSRHGLARRIFDSAPVQALGRVSYSTYLGHMLVMWVVQAAVFHFRPAVTAPQMVAALLGIGGPLIFLLSLALYHWVEAPAIRFGRNYFRH